MANPSLECQPYEGLPQNQPIDRERARELYKYFRPPVASEPLDTVLTAHAQLVAWRLNAERAMISLIDEETQFFVAESTKTVHLDDAGQYDNPEDAIWAGCVRVPKVGRLCEHTISSPQPPDGGPACFEVLDLSKDIRFNKLGFIAGPPHFRYYAGVPLRTNRGINIGSIYVLDSKLKPALTPNEKGFLGTMADNVIQHLEMSRDKKDRQRTFRMNECLSAFVDPAFEDARHGRRHSHYGESVDADSDTDSRHTADSSNRIEVVSRAAELLREAMDIEEGGGGVLFLDTALAAVPPQEPFVESVSGSEVVTVEESECKESCRSTQQMDGSNSASTTRPNTRSSSPDTREKKKKKKRIGGTEILAHTYRSDSTSPDQPEFLPFAPEELLKIIKNHPRGKLFTFDQQGEEVSDSSDNGSALSGPRSKRRQQISSAESTSLHAHLPKARQIIFIPLWDSTTGRSAACFVYNCSEYRNFSHGLDFLHCITFNSCVDTELLRLANLKENEQKSDFIGSISHELRSPLHGILASCEFLQDTKCTSFQQSLVNTAESCARTLLDTVNMVLDYSKINAFERSKTNGISQDDLKSHHHEALQTSLSTHRNVDLAMLTEEVVEGVATGHSFSDPLNRALSHETGDTKHFSRKPSTQVALAPCRPNVELVVEISEQNWTYWCEPGSIRRIVMNLIGNSLKYTKAGFVHVKLTTHTDESSATEFLTLSVTDSGQGMSPAYLKNKLFTPFAQESNQAPGVGLGLSLVKSIVSTLDGHIYFDSKLGVGTKATVQIPIKRDTMSISGSDSAANETHPGIETGPTDCNRIIEMIKSQAVGRSVALYQYEQGEVTSGQREAARLMRKSLTAYLSAWWGFTLSDWHKDSLVDIVIAEEAGLDSLLHKSPHLSEPDCKTTVLVLRNTPSVQNVRLDSTDQNNFENVRHPLGPHKLARALLACLSRSHSKMVGAGEEKSPGNMTMLSVDSITATMGDFSISDKESTSSHAKKDSFDSHNDKSKAQTVITLTCNETESKANESHPSPFDLKTTIVGDTSPGPSPAKLDSINDQGVPSSVAKPLASDENANPRPTNSPAISTCAQRVLLVDDNIINLRLLQFGMKKRGYTTISNAENGLQAVNTYRSLLYAKPPTPPNIILMDLSMPVMNGFEATRQIREIEAEYNGTLETGQSPHHSLIIALTGLASIRDQKEAYTCGVDSYIMKPVSFAKLTKSLEGWTRDGRLGEAEGLPDNTVTTE